MPDGMIPKSAGLIPHVHSGKEPRENVWKGRPIQENLRGDWTNLPSFTFKVDQLDFLLPVEPAHNSFRFGALVRGWVGWE